MGFERCGRVQPHERAIARLIQELGVNERRKQRVAVRGVKPPQPARLRGREPQPRHLEKFPLDTPEHVFSRDWLWRQTDSSDPSDLQSWELLCGVIEQPECHATRATAWPSRSGVRLKTFSF